MNVLLITQSYPYAMEKTFIDPELAALSAMPEYRTGLIQLYIAPLFPLGEMVGLVPEGIPVVDWIAWPSGESLWKRTLSALTCPEFWMEAVRFPITVRWSSLSWRGLKRLIAWASLRRHVFRCLDQAIPKSLQALTVYTYWFDGATSACLDLKKKQKGLITKVVTRAHGGDLYDERRYHPRRHADMEDLTKIFAVSRAGQAYLTDKYNQPGKVLTQYLGVADGGGHTAASLNQESNCLALVSCSSLITLKRVPLICAAVIELARRDTLRYVKWTHYGSGPDESKIQAMLKNRPSNLHVQMMGDVANQEVRSALRAGFFHCIVNVSESEGLPISLMEAAEAGVPMVATAVGGTPEIVTNEVGALLSPSPTINDIADAIERIAGPDWIKISQAARRCWSERFDAYSNHQDFYRKLLELGA